ncbi:hypothetical protein PISMIDRAFT_684625, partial [Pisolithus microcarpus 441]
MSHTNAIFGEKVMSHVYGSELRTGDALCNRPAVQRLNLTFHEQACPFKVRRGGIDFTQVHRRQLFTPAPIILAMFLKNESFS